MADDEATLGRFEAARIKRNGKEALVTGDPSSAYGRLFFQAETFKPGRLAERRVRPAGTVVEPAREVPLFRECDVLVAGGGPAGTAAAITAARAGADVVLIERHNHLGGLSTGGLVIWIDRMTDWSGTPVIRGVAAELLERLPRDSVAGPPRLSWGNADAATAAYWKERTAAFHSSAARSSGVKPEEHAVAKTAALAGPLILHNGKIASSIRRLPRNTSSSLSSVSPGPRCATIGRRVSMTCRSGLSVN
jgi:FAD dependent oxidoreductase